MRSTTLTKKIAVARALTFLLCAAALFGQQRSSLPSSSAGPEYPVIMQQNVAAGNPVGTKLQAKLTIATMVNGVVVPQDALLSGQITESMAKSATNPSRLAIRMDSVEWKNGSAAIKVFVTAWYYRSAAVTNQDLSSGLQPIHSPQHWRGQPNYANSPTPQAFPGPAASTSDTAKLRVLMKDVESMRSSDGAITLTSKRFNIKLDKQTTYVLAATDLLPTR